jgi:phosphatidylserine/phosphatidylglycerophosphate/cardiolipin synthase-like enzyme
MWTKLKKSLLIQAYSFTSAPIAKAIIDAKKRGVDVKIILDKSQFSQKYSSVRNSVETDRSFRMNPTV